MRTLIIALLAGATLATPLAAQDRPDDPGRTRPAHGDRTQPPPQSAARPEAARSGPVGTGQARPDGAQGRYRETRPDPTPGNPRPDRGPGNPSPQRDQGYRGDPRQHDDQQRAYQQRSDQQRDQGYRGDRGPQGDGRPGDYRHRDRAFRGDPRADRGPQGDLRERDDRQRDQGYRGDPRFARGPQGDLRGRDDRQHDQGYRGDPRQGFGNRSGQWDRGWRSQPGHDWQGFREANRDRFHGPRYAPPRGYGYGYRRWSVGLSLAPVFFGSGYWLGDAGYYGLPPAYGPYRWVRYYDDVLLVDVRTGYVADAIYGFFW